MGQRLIIIVLLALFSGWALQACTDDKPPSRKSGESKPDCEKDAAAEGCAEPEPDDPEEEVPPGGEEGEDVPPPPAEVDNFLQGVEPLSDEDAVKFIVDNCTECHDSKNGAVRSFWPLEKDTFDKKKLSTDTLAPTVYYALVMKAKDIIGGKPSAMPPTKLKADEAKALLGLIKWMEVEMPAVASEGKIRYGKGVENDDNGVGVILNFKCSEPATFREYIRRVTNDAFGREPTAPELELAGKDPDEKTNADDRTMVANRLFDDEAWKTEFVDKALRKLSHKIAGSADIKAIDGLLTEPQATDLKDEFYQLMKKYWESKSFRDILLMDKVMVTSNTSGLYESCATPSGPWGECSLSAPRGSYFTTVGYLSSKPSSFLRENNNYGRSALMFFIVRGDVFRAAFDQDGGAETVKPLPDCLKSKDFRGKKQGAAVAWRGAAAIPSYANLCQSCHIERQMASGSILYRPYNSAGLLYGTAHPLNTDADFAQATAVDIVNKLDMTGADEVVNQAFLQNLLDDTEEQACVPGRGEDPDLMLTKVKDLATYLIGDGRVLAGGLARHLPRSISNLDNTSEEIIVKINQAFAADEGKLKPIFKAYFASETYACKR